MCAVTRSILLPSIFLCGDYCTTMSYPTFAQVKMITVGVWIAFHWRSCLAQPGMQLDNSVSMDGVHGSVWWHLWRHHFLQPQSWTLVFQGLGMQLGNSVVMDDVHGSVWWHLWRHNFLQFPSWTLVFQGSQALGAAFCHTNMQQMVARSKGFFKVCRVLVPDYAVDSFQWSWWICRQLGCPPQRHVAVSDPHNHWWRFTLVTASYFFMVTNESPPHRSAQEQYLCKCLWGVRFCSSLKSHSSVAVMMQKDWVFWEPKQYCLSRS